MKGYLGCASLLVVFGFICLPVFAQGDMSNPSGLPTRIGGTACNNSSGRSVASITGFLNVTGVSEAGKTPTFSVAVYAGGAFVARKRLKSGDSFVFYCVPRENVILVGEVDSTEVSSVSMGMLPDLPGINRQDVNINWADKRSSKDQPGVLSARHVYERNKSNQKLFDRVLDELQAAKSDSAAKNLKVILEDDPKDWAAWALLGNIHFNSSRFEDAEKAYDRAVELKSDYMSALIGGGRTGLNLKKPEKAIEILKAAYAIEPNSADVNHYLGEAYFQIRKGSLGIPHMNRAIEIDPNGKADLHLRIAALYNVAGAKALAANEYKLFLQKRPDYPDRQKMEKYIAENLQEKE
jgi:Tfp pilus assembly protein PilF